MNNTVRKKSPVQPQANRRLWRVVTQRTQVSIWTVVVAGLICIGSGIGGIILLHYAKQHPYFAASELVVLTDGTLSQDEVRRWAGVSLGVNIIDLDVRAIEQRLVEHPWIQAAAVAREFPQRIHISVQERHPIALIRRPAAAYLDGGGRSFVAPVSVVHDLPYISGLERISLETPTALAVLADVRLCLSLAQEWGVGLSEIHWDERRGYSIFLAERQVAIRLGQEIQPAAFVLVRQVLEAWPPDRPAAVFDTRFADQIVVRPLPLRPHSGRDVELTRTL